MVTQIPTQTSDDGGKVYQPSHLSLSLHREVPAAGWVNCGVPKRIIAPRVCVPHLRPRGKPRTRNRYGRLCKLGINSDLYLSVVVGRFGVGDWIGPDD